MNRDSWPSVTQTMGPWTDKVLAKIPEALLDRAAKRGTAVHDYCGRIALGEWVVGIPTEHQGYVTSFNLWFDSQVAEVILVETRLYDEILMFHGRPDLIVRLVDGRFALVDLKTPVQHHRAWAVQLAAYNHLATGNKYQIDVSGTLRLDNGGRTPTMKWYTEGKRPFVTFQSALNVHHYMMAA
ncbi:MAG TPA: hypothetical protein PLD71_10620 [Syntrophales bacterium]|nr:hypothetical protein [Syntrophales bacterium]